MVIVFNVLLRVTHSNFSDGRCSEDICPTLLALCRLGKIAWRHHLLWFLECNIEPLPLVLATLTQMSRML